MKRSLLFLVAACGAQPKASVPTSEPNAIASASSSAEVSPAPPTTRDHIVRFASARGGLHGEPVRMPYRMFKLNGAECWLFFVGGEVAHQAWLATPWDPAWGKASKKLPHVDAVVQAPLLEDGVVFERVDHWPRAVRVVSTSPSATGVVVKLETLAARDQPAGLTGTFDVEDDITSGSMPTASPARPQRALVNEKAVVVALRSINASKAALAAALAPDAELVEIWQRAFSRTTHLARTDVTQAMRDALVNATSNGCDRTGSCVDDRGAGVALAPSGAGFRVTQVFVATHAVSTQAEPAPTRVERDADFTTFRMNETADGELRTITSVTIGDRRLSVVRDDESAYLVERDGAYSRVTSLWSRRHDKSTVDARIEDVNGDGVNDVVVFAHWPKHEPAAAAMYENHTFATVAFRARTIESDLARDPFGTDIDLIGARDLDDASKRAHSPVIGARTTSKEACALLAASTTPPTLAHNAVATARIVSFDEPQDPSSATRLVPVTHASVDDALQLKSACGDSSEGGFMCRGGLCGNLDYGLGSIYRFVRERGVLKLETALLYTGS